jgi:hypothetical protein
MVSGGGVWVMNYWRGATRRTCLLIRMPAMMGAFSASSFNTDAAPKRDKMTDTCQKLPELEFGFDKAASVDNFAQLSRNAFCTICFFRFTTDGLIPNCKQMGFFTTYFVLISAISDYNQTVDLSRRT